MKTRSLAAALLTVAPFAFLGTYGFAHGSPNHSAAQRATEVTAPPRADVKPFEHAKLSLVQAVSDAQKELRGNILGARFEVWNGKPTYLIRTYTANEIWQERVDANTGQPLGQPTSVPQSQLGKKLQNNVAALQNVKTNFIDAVNNAEQKQGGKAMMAAVEAQQDGTVSYKLELLKHGRLQVAMVNAQEGQLR